MSFTPIIPLSGYSGWVMLNKTMERQQTTFSASAQNQRLEDYFREKIGTVNSAEELVSDRRLLTVALGAFGLDNDINSKYFIKKVLDEGTLDETAFSNKLADKTYYNLSAAFGFGDYDTPLSQQEGFADSILQKFEQRQFEVAVGDVNESYRIALTAERELPAIGEKTSNENTKWYSIIGSKSLSSFMRTALSLPEAISSLDVDQQITIFKNKAKEAFGTDVLSDILADGGLERLTRNYVIRAELVDGVTSTSSTSPALTLLQGQANSSGNSILSLLL